MSSITRICITQIPQLRTPLLQTHNSLTHLTHNSELHNLKLHNTLYSQKFFSFQLKNTFQALLIRVNNGQDGDQWFLKTYLAALSSSGNTGPLGTFPSHQSETTFAQV